MKRISMAGLCVSAVLGIAAVAAAPATATSNGAYAWGNRLLGDIGDGTESGPTCEVGQSICAPTPVAVSGLGEASGNSVTALAGDGFHSLALLSNGKVMAWGDSGRGESGNGTTAAEQTPVEVGGLTKVVAIAVGFNYSLALRDDGKVMAWGGNEHGQLGDGTEVDKHTPVEVSELSGVVAIAAGNYHSLALLSDGTVRAWGDDKHGQLGDKEKYDSDKPVVVQKGTKALGGVTAISAGGFGTDGDEHSLALLGSGTVMAWGDGEYGELGLGTTATHRAAVEVKKLNGLGVTAISAGGRHSLALLSNGTVRSWGWNGRDELGDGVPSVEEDGQSNEPVEVLELTGVTAISAGESFSLALRSDKSVVAWGWNAYDELGNGAIGQESDVPVAVSGLAGIEGIGAGGEHGMAFGPSAE